MQAESSAVIWEHPKKCSGAHYGNRLGLETSRCQRWRIFSLMISSKCLPFGFPKFAVIRPYRLSDYYNELFLSAPVIRSNSIQTPDINWGKSSRRIHCRVGCNNECTDAIDSLILQSATHMTDVDTHIVRIGCCMAYSRSHRLHLRKQGASTKKEGNVKSCTHLKRNKAVCLLLLYKYISSRLAGRWPPLRHRHQYIYCTETESQKQRGPLQYERKVE